MRSNNFLKVVFCLIGILFVFVFGKFFLYQEPIPQLDRKILEWFAVHRRAEFDWVFTHITWAGSRFLLMPILAVVVLILIIRKNLKKAFFMVATFFGASLLSLILKQIVARPRPCMFQIIGESPTGFSYPSSHAIQITAFVLAFLLISKSHLLLYWKITFNILGGVLILLVCLSRLYLQVHFPTDVMAGFLTAILWIMGLEAFIPPSNRGNTNSLPISLMKKGKCL